MHDGSYSFSSEVTTTIFTSISLATASHMVTLDVNRAGVIDPKSLLFHTCLHE